MLNGKTGLTASNIKYLLALNELCKSSNEVRCVCVAEFLGVSKPSVHAMTETLKEMKIINKDLYGLITYTEYGTALAKQYEEYSMTISRWVETVLPYGTDIRPAVCALMSELDSEQLNEMCCKIDEQEKNK